MPRGAAYFNQVQRVDDSGAAAWGDAEDGLREFEGGVHPGRWVEKPCAQVQGRMLRIALIVRNAATQLQARAHAG